MPDGEENGAQADAQIRKLAGFQTLIPQFDNMTAITPKFFIETLEETTNIAKCSNKEKLLILRSRLRGDALTNVINSPDLNHEKDYDQFKKKFLAYFDTQFSLAARQRQFANCKMLPRELVKVYAARVAVATQHFFNSPDLANDGIKAIFEQSKLAKFIEGLSANYKQSVILKDPKNFDEAVNFVQMLQANELSSSDTGSDPTINNINKDATTDQIKTLIEAHAFQTREMVNSLSKEIENLKLQSQNSQQYERPRQTHAQYNMRPPYKNNSNYNNHYSYSRQSGNFNSRNTPPCNFCSKISHRSDDCYYNPSNRGNYRGRGYQFQRNSRSTFRGRSENSHQSRRYGDHQNSENA